MAEGEDSPYENWGLAEKMELEKQEWRKPPQKVLSLPGSSLGKAIMLLYVLLALTFVLLMTLTIVSLCRASSVQEALEGAQMRSEEGQAVAWQNLSKVQHTLEKKLSGELQVIHSQLLNVEISLLPVSREVENVQWKVAQSKAGGERELWGRLHALEEKDLVGPLQQQLKDLKEQQSRNSELLTAVLEDTKKLSEILCTSCPGGWRQFLKTCYFFSGDTKPWLGAKEFCDSYNAHLAVVETEQEDKFLATHILEQREFWLGLSDIHSEGDWHWVNGRPLTFSLWKKGEPNNVGAQGEDCATIYSSGYWNDISCTSSIFWICERSC
ncbi:CD209 antigen-like isoform X1 [Heliangelus exortis]|uniref:CD209 antigen-like isoform X1 n=1 Tax=Heliangelus exortis TaxID=472823 RepID=UPI003A8F1F2E